MSSPYSSYIFKRNGINIKNRVVLAAMTNKQSYKDGRISQNEIDWLTYRAKGGFGIITTAAAHVSKDGQGWEGEFGLFNDNLIDDLSILTKSIQKYNSLIIAQLFHGGMRSPQKLTGVRPLSASRIPCDVSTSGFTRSASVEDINKIIDDFTSAAIRCVESGFDGIELHGAHGYLLSQFLSKKINNRKDRWGGDIYGRSKIVRDIISSIKNNVPDSFILGIRISPEIDELGIYLNESIELVKILNNLGVDFIHISCWDIYSRSIEYRNNSKTLTEWFTHSIDNLPAIISTGNIWSSIDAKNVMKQGADFIGVARVAIPYPDWANNLGIDNYNPKKAPFTVKKLKEAGLSNTFINYMRKWNGFVCDGYEKN